MLRRRVLSFFRDSPASQIPSDSAKLVEDGKSKSMGRKAVSFILITVTGGIALSAADDLAIYHSCSSKAMEKASKHQELAAAIGGPVVKGPWYNASLAVAHKRRSVSCTFPVSGPQGNGVLQLKAVRNGDEGWLSSLRHRDWEILIMDALLHVPSNDEKQQTVRISLSNDVAPACTACVPCRPQESMQPETK